MELDYIKIAISDNAQFPHCDSGVLHAPGECTYCDLHPDWQKERIQKSVNFTGQSESLKTTCPSDATRGTGGAHVWGGNRPHDPNEDEEFNFDDWFIPTEKPSAPKCTCGSDSVGGGGHSSWCDKQ